MLEVWALLLDATEFVLEGCESFLICGERADRFPDVQLWALMRAD